MSGYPEPYSPYCGLVYNDASQPERASGAPHLLVSAPTRTGKTRRLLAPAAVMHPGPVVAVSSKPDLAELVLARRCTGITGVIDLCPEKTPVWPHGVRRMITDPTATIRSATDALTVAETMLATSGVGFGGGSGSQSVAADGLWESTASKPLACLLYAASPLGLDQGMSWVLKAVENLGGPDEDAVQTELHATPSWATAASVCPHARLSEPTRRALTFDPRMRDSVAITVSKAVTPWVRLGLSESDDQDKLSAVDRLSIDAFDIDMLDEPDSTLFVIAPNTGAVAGAAVALIDSIIRHFRKRTAEHQMEHRLLLELDEVCNSCPLPALLNYIGESAGLGVNIMATVQASSHFDVVYSPKYADALRDIFPGTMVMYGAHERHLLEQASHWSGLATRRTESYEPNGGSRSQSSQLGSTIEWQELLPQSVEEAQLLLRGTPGRRVQIPDWTQFLAIYDQAVDARRRHRVA